MCVYVYMYVYVYIYNLCRRIISNILRISLQKTSNILKNIPQFRAIFSFFQPTFDFFFISNNNLEGEEREEGRGEGGGGEGGRRGVRGGKGD